MTNTWNNTPNPNPMITLFFTPSSCFFSQIRQNHSEHSQVNLRVIYIHRHPHHRRRKTSKFRIRRPPKIMLTIIITIKIDPILATLSRIHEHRRNRHVGAEAVCSRGRGRPIIVGTVPSWPQLLFEVQKRCCLGNWRAGD
jgi:hypothetical protein